MLNSPRVDSGLTVERIVELTGAKPRQGDSLDRRISNFASLDMARPFEISFLDNPKYADGIRKTQAGACLMEPRFEAAAPKSLVALITPQPYRAFVTVARALFPEALRPSSLSGESRRSGQAHIHPSARLEEDVVVDPFAMIGPRAEVGKGTVIAAGAAIGAGVCIGRECAIGAGATIQHSLIGDRVIIHPGARIGQDGFGYLPGPQGHQKIPQSRRVIIQDDVEVGANTTIDRGSTRDTVIGEGSKIDNLVQIAHNVIIGRHCLIASQTGISGSVRVGDFVVMGGQAGVADHVTIGTGVMLAGQAGVGTDVGDSERWGGSPAVPAREWMQGVTALRRLARRSSKPRGTKE